MRQDQYEKLQVLAEKLMDVFLEEADPETWPGAGIAVATLDQQSRGDRYWCKKNAVATASVMLRATALAGKIQMASAMQSGSPEAVTEDAAEGEPTLDQEVAQFEREATKLLDKVQSKVRKEQFDKRTHGKA